MAPSCGPLPVGETATTSIRAVTCRGCKRAVVEMLIGEWMAETIDRAIKPFVVDTPVLSPTEAMQREAEINAALLRLDDRPNAGDIEDQIVEHGNLNPITRVETPQDLGDMFGFPTHNNTCDQCGCHLDRCQCATE